MVAMKVFSSRQGIAIGTNWQEVFMPYTMYLVAAGVVLGLYVAFVWFRK